MVTMIVTEEERIENLLNASFVGEYLKDPGITDISYDGAFMQLQHNETGVFTPAPEKQPSLEAVRILIKQIADAQKKTFNNSEPELNTEVGYLRLNAIHDSVSPDGMTFSIRVSRPRLAISSLASMTVGNREEVEQLLGILVRAKSNIVISGSTGTGKTEVQKKLVGYASDDEKITLIEDTRDSHLKKLYPNKHINSWRTLSGVFFMSDAVKAALRNNSKWVIISEVRGSEAADMLDGAKTDHAVITTIHATGAKNIPSRLIPLIRQTSAYAKMDDQLLGKEIVGLLPFGVHLESETIDGKIYRWIKEIVEFTDFTPQGAVCNYVYRELKTYDEQTNTYKSEEQFGPLSENTLNKLKDKRLYHLLPDLFKNVGHGEEMK